MKLVLVSTYPPRRCGIATFAADLRDALMDVFHELDCSVVSVLGEEAAPECRSEVRFAIRQSVLQDYIRASDFINSLQPDVVCIQHEYGIFGGAAGSHILALTKFVSSPIVTTLHTILNEPSADERFVLNRIIGDSTKLVVMSPRGREILHGASGIPTEKVVVIPHGAPESSSSNILAAKSRLGFRDRDVLLSFGLMSPDKGIEHAIQALPDILRVRPGTIYLVIGVTHPNLLSYEGERYRLYLEGLASKLGVSDAVVFINKYLPLPDLLAYVEAADVCVMPYKNEAQVTSGTLSIALGLRKAIVATPFWHARDTLGTDCGSLAPFGDIEAISRAVTALLTNVDLRRSLQRQVEHASTDLSWSQAGRHYQRVLEACRSVQTIRNGPNPRINQDEQYRELAVSLKGVERLTDGCGILQHSRLGIPATEFGYCLDDNARALILTHSIPGRSSAALRRLSGIYLSFVERAWDNELQSFRNFMNYDQHWLNEAGSEDCFGRAVWALAVTGTRATEGTDRRRAREVLSVVLPHIRRITWPRSNAFVLIGLSELCSTWEGLTAVRPIIIEKAALLSESLAKRRRTSWPWFEDNLTYDNARLPEALIRCGWAIRNDELIQAGLESLRWLCGRQRSSLGHFRPIGTGNFAKFRSSDQMFDQQPLEAAATIDACQAAYLVDKDVSWLTEAKLAYEWYLGLNDLCVPLADPRLGECFDGLAEYGPNLNQGAESVLAFQLATCTMQLLPGLCSGAAAYS